MVGSVRRIASPPQDLHARVKARTAIQYAAWLEGATLPFDDLSLARWHLDALEEEASQLVEAVDDWEQFRREADLPSWYAGIQAVSLAKHARYCGQLDAVGLLDELSHHWNRYCHPQGPDAAARAFARECARNCLAPLLREARRRVRPHHAKTYGSRLDVGAVKDRLAIEDVIGRDVDLRKRGGRYVGLCPFHDDHTPSFYVYPEQGTFHCFGCGVHGDAIDYLQRRDNLNFAEALRRLAAVAGIDGREDHDAI